MKDKQFETYARTLAEALAAVAMNLTVKPFGEEASFALYARAVEMMHEAVLATIEVAGRPPHFSPPREAPPTHEQII